jgi:hypothetical protein
MDVTMPGIGGIAAARRILAERHDVVVVLVSVDDPWSPSTTPGLTPESSPSAMGWPASANRTSGHRS